MSGYTKGPWYVTEDDCIRQAEGQPRLYVASITDIPTGRGGVAETSANALLMAASPDLYEAAMDFLHGYCKETSEAFHERMSDLAFRFSMATNKAVGK